MTTRAVLAAGAMYLAGMIGLAASRARLGTPTFFICVAAAALAYLFVLSRVWAAARDPRGADPGRRAFALAIALALVFRFIHATGDVGAGNDMYRYVWDGRVQTLGYNPFAVLPSDPALAATHVDDRTRLMPSRDIPTFYPPAAQLFFRGVVTLYDSVYAMKLALVACDLLTMLVVWRWVRAAGRSRWLTLGYAWNPLVVMEVSFSGHVDALCALWTVLCFYCLSRRKGAWAAAAFALAIASKLLPIVLAPLLLGRVRIRDAALGAAVLIAVYLPFVTGANPVASMSGLVQGIRFNGPLFLAMSAMTSAQVAAALAVVAGAATALACRLRFAPDDPTAWAWPMAVSLLFAPVAYPWYLLSLTPFLLLPSALPLIAWTISIVPVYLVWERSRTGGAWVVPAWALAVEYGSILMTWLISRRRDLLSYRPLQ